MQDTGMATEKKEIFKTCSIFDVEVFKDIIQGIQVSPLMKSKQITSPANEDISQLLQDLNVSHRLFCSFCDVSFPDHLHQRQHYKLDWHRYNLKQHLAHKKHVSEDKFNQIAEMDDVSSISGSESDSELETEMSSATDTEAGSVTDKRLSHLVARRAHLLFQNRTGHLLSLHQCLLHDKKVEPPTEEQLVSLASQLPTLQTWMIIMLGGGHMAAAIFKGMEAVLHKTFHSYTVRAKQGGAQSGKDNSGKHAKSAGASLRRYNEQTLTQHVQEILSAWAPEVASCQLIFYRAVGPFNRSMLFGGKSPPLSKADPRLRTVPFPTRRATFSELQRVHALLATVTIYESPEQFRSSLASPRRVWREEADGSGPVKEKITSPRKQIDRAKSRQSPERALPDIINELAAIQTSESESDQEEPMLLNNEEISFNDSLKEFEDTMPRKIKKKKKKKELSPENELSADVKSFRRKVFTACESVDATLLTLTIEQEGSVISEAERVEAFNQQTPHGLTLLQRAAQRANTDLVWILLDNGGNPCTRDKKAMTAYDFAPDKVTRNVFRRFMGKFPEKYDYSRSHIPSPLTDNVEQEQAEKRRALRKAKRQKEKEKRIADEPRRQEEAEQKRFLELTDREKRALAAERRLLASAGQAKVVLSRCYLCATDITGKVPFTYETFLFCSIDCLKAHRKQLKTL